MNKSNVKEKPLSWQTLKRIQKQEQEQHNKLWVETTNSESKLPSLPKIERKASQHEKPPSASSKRSSKHDDDF